MISGIFEDFEGHQFKCDVSLWERVWLSEPIIVRLESKESYAEELIEEDTVEDLASFSKSSGS